MSNCRNVIAVLALLLFAAGCSSSKSEGTQQKIVKTENVQMSVQHTISEFPGRVKAAKEVNMSFMVSGTLQKIVVAEGEFVKEGALIAVMDDKDYRLQYEATKAEYENIKAQAERVFALYADSATTAQTYDNAKYGLAQISAKYENSKNQLAYTKIYAPFDCYIQKHIIEGATVVGAGMPVVSIISASVPEVEINIPAAEFANRENFKEFFATFDFMPGKKMALKIVSISPKANANQLYNMRLRFESGERAYPSPGMNTLVEIISSNRDSLYTEIPATALFSKEGKSYVWVCNNGKVEQREVEVSFLNLAGKAIIASGVEAGEEIVSAGVHSLRNGESVKVMEKPSKTNVGGLL